MNELLLNTKYDIMNKELTPVSQEEWKLVREHLETARYSKIWLCPSKVYNPKFNSHPYLLGFECAKYNVPDIIANSLAEKIFYEAKTTCIIWHNTLEIEEQINSMAKAATVAINEIELSDENEIETNLASISMLKEN